MGSLNHGLSEISLRQTNVPRAPSSFQFPRLKISCGLRNLPKTPLGIGRGRVLSTEAIQAVQSLKLAKNSSSRLELVFSSKLGRLLKSDLLDTLAELQRQDEIDLALKVFMFLRKEPWYVPDVSLFNNMILMVGKYRMIEAVEELFSELKKEGLEPNVRTYTELIGAYFKVEMVGKAMETYELLKGSGLTPDELTLTILIKNLEKAGEEELAVAVKRECADYFDYPEKFLAEVAKKYPKKKKLIVI